MFQRKPRKKDGFVEKIDKNNIQNVREDENVWVVKFDDER